MQNLFHWIEKFKTKLLQKDSYFSEFFWESYDLPKLTLEFAFSKNRENKSSIDRSHKIIDMK